MCDVDEPEQATGTVFFEHFEFKDKEIKIKQDTLKGHAAILWDAARVSALVLQYMCCTISAPCASS